jgi:hypothetical protein
VTDTELIIHSCASTDNGGGRKNAPSESSPATTTLTILLALDLVASTPSCVISHTMVVANQRTWATIQQELSSSWLLIEQVLIVRANLLCRMS